MWTKLQTLKVTRAKTFQLLTQNEKKKKENVICNK